VPPEQAAAAEPLTADTHAAGHDEAGAGGEGDRPDSALLLVEISAGVRELAQSSERYHARAEQREAVIDHLRDEVERLRRGERRSLLRPLLVELCRLRNDLLGQAEGLPADFTPAQAAELLRSYADTVEQVLENGGVTAFEPDPDAPFDPRVHRRVGTEPTGDPALQGRIARVRRSGYLDVAAASPITAAEVVLYTAAAPAQTATRPQPDSVTETSEMAQPASSASPDKRAEP
jgi:molecular chaperone GrpE (heat shock protein)